MKRFLIFFLSVFVLSYAGDKGKILLDQEIEVLRSDFKAFHYLVPETPEKEYEFAVSFKAKGGFNDDIIFIVMTQENYVRWFSKYDFQAAVKTEKVTKSDFKVKAKQGETYYFVMDNFFSGVSNKKVKLKITLAAVES
jgi:hypothetical protein